MSTTTAPLEGTVIAAPAAVKILGREPAVLLGTVEAFLLMCFAAYAAYGSANFDGNGFVVLVMALLSALVGAYTAWATKDTMLGALTGAVKAIINLVIFFGLDLPMELQAAILSFVAMAVGFFQRTQTSPVAAPVDPSPAQVVESPVEVTPAAGEHRDDDGDGVADGYRG